MESNRDGVNGRSVRLAEDFSAGVYQEQAGVDAVVGLPLALPSSPRLVALLEQNNVGAERFRVLAGRMQYLQKQNGIKQVAITSAEQGDGKSVTAANLALTLARRQSTLLIDGDLRQSGLNRLFATQSARGLTDWWSSSKDICQFLMRGDNNSSFWYLPAGDAAEQPLEILQSPRIGPMLRSLSQSFDWIIIDSPPLVPVTDGHIWSTHADGTLLVIRQGKTSRRLLQASLEDAGNLKLLGAVMNGAKERRHQYYYAPSSYGQVRSSGLRQADNKRVSSSSEWSAPRK